jgi:hypothetical protein
MAAFIDILKAIGLKLCEIFMLYAKETQEAEISYDPSLQFWIIFWILFFFGSAFWATSIASMRRHPPLIHFLLGFVLPWAYPIYILFAMDIHGEKERREAEQEMIAQKEAEEEEKRRIQEELNARKAVVESEAGIQSTNSRWSSQYFNSIARDAEGRNAGPWKAVVSGTEIIVLEIIEAEEDLVYVVFKGYNDEPSKMRIPYAKIESWEKTVLL